MRGLPARRGATPHKPGARLALTASALALSVGVAFAVESGAIRLRHDSTQPASAGAFAQQDDQGDRNNHDRGQVLSRAQAIALVQQRYRAQVVRAQRLQDQSGRALYEFRLLSAGGKVWSVRIDAYSGAEVQP